MLILPVSRTRSSSLPVQPMVSARKLLCASHRSGTPSARQHSRTLTIFSAKIVIGDRDLVGAQQVVATIKQTGGSAVCIALDVRNWDDQVDMFELAMKEYGSVDIVVRFHYAKL